MKRAHAQRLREVYRSAGWPYQDGLEIELLAAGLLERLGDGQGQELIRVTHAGLIYLADALAGNRQAFSAHEALVAQVAQAMLRDGRGKQIASADEIPAECGVMLCQDQRLSVLRAAPKRPVRHLPFGVWMALAKATPVKAQAAMVDGLRDQAPLVAGVGGTKGLEGLGR